LTGVIRFINDILLSAPSIIIGLFIYGAIVVRWRVSGFRRVPRARRDCHSRGGAHHRDMLLLGAQSAARGGIRARLPRSLVIKRLPTAPRARA